MENLPLDTESKVLIILTCFLIIGAICFIGNWFAKLISKHLEDLPEYTKKDYKREKKAINKFKNQ